MPRFEPHPQRRPALVTGASSGIGAATAVLLAAAGHPVALGARRTDRCEDLAETIRKDGGEVFTHPLDVSDSGSVERFVSAAAGALGEPEIVVSGAGDLGAERVHELASEDFAAQLQVHLVGAHRLVSRVVPGMVARGRGDVVLVSSDVVRAPRTRMGAYVAAKNGVEGMARALQMELEGTGVRISVVRPGPTMTGMGMGWDAETTGEVLEEWVRWGLARHPYFLRAEDVAAVIAAVVAAPRGTHLTLVEVQPEAAVAKPAAARSGPASASEAAGAAATGPDSPAVSGREEGR
ncbi:SDR family oxidoreductase [Planomonospora sp. ID67723]|uniref:SDR family oxidoreductase n=1 Tax=Planomonospora sp. ID67723 TaxID=2738134 RepID=UPI0018C35FE1|nr:SDR family oxidoreductase [Planomonospora sp. ID67723]MBG0829140.1 SDR family oxidoreductase [Planomonospora sp. ID67723]